MDFIPCFAHSKC